MLFSNSLYYACAHLQSIFLSRDKFDGLGTLNLLRNYGASLLQSFHPGFGYLLRLAPLYHTAAALGNVCTIPQIIFTQGHAPLIVGNSFHIADVTENTHISTHMQWHTHIYTYTHAYTHTRMHTHVHTHETHMHIHIRTHACIHTYIHMKHAYTYTYTYTYIPMQIDLSTIMHSVWDTRI